MPRNYSIKDTIEQEKQKRLGQNNVSLPSIKHDKPLNNQDNTSILNIHDTSSISVDDQPNDPIISKGFFAKLFGWK
jgi:hypothetical protein